LPQEVYYEARSIVIT